MDYYDMLRSERGVAILSLSEGDAERLVLQLHEMESLHGVPREELEWLVRESKLLQFPIGARMKTGDTVEDMLFFLEGEMQGYVVQNGQKKIQFTSGPGAFGSLLPFSRMKLSPVYADFITPVKALSLHRSRFREFVAANYELTEVIVHSMTDRVRHFSALHFQNEKLMSLGKLSAGLAHELNNPAAAIVRSAEDLKKTIGSLTENLNVVSALELEASEIENISPLLQNVTNASARLPLLERKRREADMADWLDAHRMSGDAAETFVSFGFTTDDLDRIQHGISERSFLPLLQWLANSLQAERAVYEIGTASRRISELVQSVKSYTRMDQVQDMQELCINDGIRNTITMLQHKMRKNSVVLHEDLAEGLPLIFGFPGELNQVWTNIIDNALDAMKNGGELSVQTMSGSTNVIFNVIDTGPGISPENLERIFDPFFTTKDVGEGTGVGLDVVQKVVTQHKGKIDVTSKPGRTEFRVSFLRITSEK